MANRYAVASGNWSNPSIWDGGTLPTSADDVRANGFTVTIDINISVLSIRTTALAPAVAGGIFHIANGVTLTGDIWSGSNNHGLQFNLPSGQSATIIGNVNGGGNAGSGIVMINTGTLNVVGTASANSNVFGINITTGAAGCTLNFTGSTVAVATPAINAQVQCTINFSGNLVGSALQTGAGLVAAASGCIVNINGNITAQGGSGFFTSVPCTVNASGIFTSSTSQSAIDSSNVSGLITISGELINNGGVAAVYARRIFLGNSSTIWKFRKPDLSEKILYTGDVLPGVPVDSDVRQGTVYGPSGSLTGTLQVPSPSNVRKGVPTDNTVGTAELTAQDLFNEIASSSDIIAQRLRNVATVDTTAATIAAYNS